MAWGYWTTYNTNAVNRAARTRCRNFSPAVPSRERSLERAESRAERIIQEDREKRTQLMHQEKTRIASLHEEQQLNHVPPEKVEHERRLLLGDPNWADRTIADRNTLPRKKHFDKSMESVVYKESSSCGNKSSDVSSRKSLDDVFCPACHHEATVAAASSRNGSNRDSRVSFGSVSSSRGSRTSRGSSSVRMRSRSQDDDFSPRGGGLPTPPPPPLPFQAETINQKIAILSTFKPRANNETYHQSLDSRNKHHTSNNGGRRSSRNYHSHEKLQSSRRGSSAERLEDGSVRRRSSGDPRRRSGSRTPRCSSSRTSRESIGSRESRESRRSSRPDAEDEGEDGDVDNDDEDPPARIVVPRGRGAYRYEEKCRMDCCRDPSYGASARGGANEWTGRDRRAASSSASSRSEEKFSSPCSSESMRYGCNSSKCHATHSRHRVG